MLDRSQVATTRFTDGSVRAAAGSKAKAIVVSINCIVAKAVDKGKYFC